MDFIVEREARLTPIEEKWTERPTLSDARNLVSFLENQRGKADHGYLVCRCKHPQSFAENITAIPWWGL